MARVPDLASRGIIACDFVHIDLADRRRVYTLVFAQHGTCRLHIAGVTTHPTGPWTVQQARNLAVELGVRADSLRFLLRDRDTKYTESFNAVFAADDIRVVRSAPRAPRMNAHCERIIGTLRREALDHLLFWNETRARQVLDAYAGHYNRHRPHQTRGQLPPLAHGRTIRSPGPTHPNTRRSDQRVQIRRLTRVDEFPNGTGYLSQRRHQPAVETHAG